MKKVNVKIRQQSTWSGEYVGTKTVKGRLINIHGFNWCLHYDRDAVSHKKLVISELTTGLCGGEILCKEIFHKRKLIKKIKKMPLQYVKDSIDAALIKYNNEILNVI